MNWVNSSLQMASTLLESVDQQAAITLAGDESDEENSFISNIKQRITTSTKAQNYDESASDNTQGNNKMEDHKNQSELQQIEENTDAMDSNNSMTSTRMTSPTHSYRSTNSEASAVSPRPSISTSTNLDNEKTAMKKLQQEVARLKSELRANEKLLSTTQKTLAITEEEVEALERECKDKLHDVQQEIITLRQDKEAAEKDFIQTLKTKDEALQIMRKEVESHIMENEKQKVEMEELHIALENALESKDSLWTKALSANDESAQLIASLRMELDESLKTTNNLKNEYNDTKNALLRRQTVLEQTNAELMRSISTLEGDLVRAKNKNDASVTFSKGESNSEYLNDDYLRLQEELVSVRKQINDEVQKNASQSQEVEKLKQKLKELQLQLSTSNKIAEEQLQSKVDEIALLNSQVQTLQSQLQASNVIPDLEARLETLTNRLINKQESVEDLNAKIMMYDVRLTDLQQENERLNIKLKSFVEQGQLDDIDNETLLPMMYNQRGLVKRRGTRMVKAVARIAPGVVRSRKIASAIDVLDGWLLFIGRLCLNQPFIRLAFAVYVFIIHSWVFLILTFHTNHLGEELQQTNSDMKVDNEIILPGQGGN